MEEKREKVKIGKKGNSILTTVMNMVHMALLFIPVVLYLVPKKEFEKYVRRYVKWILLFYVMIPLHWVFMEDMCVFTAISIKMGDYDDSETTSQFSEENMMWLYGPIMRVFGWKKDNTGMNKMVTLHSLINIILIWSLLK
jgi:hypothetical protein